jgi:hypothetical protein
MSVSVAGFYRKPAGGSLSKIEGMPRSKINLEKIRAALVTHLPAVPRGIEAARVDTD